jgi:hypothetical protein
MASACANIGTLQHMATFFSALCMAPSLTSKAEIRASRVEELYPDWSLSPERTHYEQDLPESRRLMPKQRGRAGVSHLHAGGDAPTDDQGLTLRPR